MTELQPGDNVSWNTPQGKTHGKITKKLTRPTSISDHKVAATAADPQYEVKSDTSGKSAAHKPDSLNKE